MNALKIELLKSTPIFILEDIKYVCEKRGDKVVIVPPNHMIVVTEHNNKVFDMCNDWPGNIKEITTII